ncbi:MAG: CsbD family protein [Candidatus Obscuribacterales bacterium]
MNKQILEGKWDQLKGKVKLKWAELTDDDLIAIEGCRDVLEGKIKERYGYDCERIKKEVDEFFEQKENASCCK